ncbi:MAG: DUF542 domain-containing protein [Planctomycetes bacterium]|nr:DUF542 domain-containing protein [Planctomycetota bacterium]
MAVTLHPNLLLPDLLQAHPQVRGILDRYGLKGCGGEHGPSETLEFFAKTHGVDYDGLCREIDDAIRNPDQAPTADYRPSLGDVIYRPFFLVGMVMAVLPGALLGTVLMGTAARIGSVVGPPLSFINAHGHAMVFGFMGLFIIGFGYQALPRFKHAALWGPKLAGLSFLLMVAGVAMHVLGSAFAYDLQANSRPGPAAVALAGSALELAAAGLFALVINRTYKSSGKKLEAYDWYVLAATGWFAFSIVAEAVHFARLAFAPEAAAILLQVAMFQEPLRVVQLYGVAAMIIFGVMLRFLPPVFGFADPGESRFKRVFVPLNLAISCVIVCFPLMVATRRGLVSGVGSYHMWEGLYWLGTLAVAGLFLWLLAGFKPWRKPTGNDRSIKFVRMAHLWFAVGVLLWVAEPLYIAGVAGSFGHGYHGALRHAMTLGFIATMIVGVSAKVVPTLNGVDPNKLSRLNLIFGLLIFAVLSRVVLEGTSDKVPFALKLLPLSGTAALVALGLWAVHVGRFIVAPPAPPSISGEVVLEADARVGAVLQRWPHLLDVFVKHGFALLKNPMLRATLARNVTLRQACELQKVNLDNLLADLKAAQGGPAQPQPPAATAATAAPAIDPALSVAEAARRWPATVPVFSRLGLDACCGGAESIAHAAEHNGVPLAQVMNELQQALQGARHD